jgi:NADPH:quinone reductase-like Zn-dependent oxidoreductase/acyl carrier protein
VLADVDVDLGGLDLAVLAAGLGCGEPRFAVRSGSVVVPRLVRGDGAGSLVVPAGTGWRVGVAERGTLDGLAVAGTDAGSRPLAAGEVRVGVRAAGVNFRDVLNVLGMYPGDPGQPGGEAAGVVLETGPGVTSLEVGDRVMGVVPEAFGPVAVADSRLLVRVPAGWSLTAAASVPVAFSTAYYALADLAGLRPGESVLIHAGAGGVGMAAVQLARHFGAEVFATASPGKHAVLRGTGLDGDHIASSRDAEFETKFRAVTGGRGVDVVLDSLRGELVDASLRLAASGGRFVEMGKTDLRDPEQVAKDFGGVSYQAFDLADAGIDRLSQILGLLAGLLAEGALTALPCSVWDVRRAPEALRFMSQARHTGKIVLAVPVPPDPDGTILVTGGTGTLGGLTARHLVTSHGVKHLLLASRRGADAPGAAALARELTGLGATVTVAACDVADRAAVDELLAAAPAAHPLTGVVHTAGVLDDGLAGSLSGERVDAVFGPKAVGAWHLHEATRDLDLAWFVLFSSAAGVLGGAGQGNYAAANTFLDALATQRQAAGQAGLSLAWGPWERRSAMTGQLDDMAWQRMRSAGFAPLPDDDALALLDAGLAAAGPVLVPLRIEPARVAAAGQNLPPILTAAGRRPARPAATRATADRDGLASRLAALPADERHNAVLDLVRGHIAASLGHRDAAAIEPGRAFSDLGFDSLTAVDLRNRLTSVTGLRLPATLIFDYPSPHALAEYVGRELLGSHDEAATVLDAFAGLEQVESALAAITEDAAARERVTARIKSILAALDDIEGATGEEVADRLQSASDDEVFAFIDKQLGTS